MRSKRTYVSSFIILSSASLLACQKPDSNQSPPIPEEVASLHHLAVEQLKLDIGDVEHSGIEKNVVGIRSKHLLVSKRLDSRTYFVQDDRYGIDMPAGIWGGADEGLVKQSRGILAQLAVPEDEIDQAIVLMEKLQTGRLDARTKTLKAGESTNGRRYVQVSRTIMSLPVFSSRGLIGLARDERIGFMELHWPVVPEATVREGLRLKEVVRKGWRPPPQEGGEVESIEAGIIHSPAMGFVMDIYPAIRVVYAPKDKAIGRKLTLYLNDQGNAVPIPRQFERIEEPPPGQRTRPGEKQKP